MNHIPYENGCINSRTGDHKIVSKVGKNKNKGDVCIYCNRLVRIERPECPIEEVIQTTEDAWENNDLYVSGNRVDNQDKD